jgi:cysteine desulfuration protein SufE
MARWRELIADFQDLEPDERLEELVELADDLPDVSPGRSVSPPPESCRVQECQTPVYLWVDIADGRVNVEAYVSKQSPTVRGLVALLVEAVDGVDPHEVLSLPEDLLQQLGLAESLGMTRQHGFLGVIRRIKREVQTAQAPG